VERLGDNYYRWLFDQALAGVCVSQDGRLALANAAMESLTGYSAQELIGLPIGALLDERDRGQVLEALQAQLAGTRGPVRSCFRIRRKDGAVKICEAHGSVGELRGQPCTIGVLLDVTEQKRAEERLRRSEERYALAVDGSRDALWDWTLGADQLYLSPRFSEMSGLVPEEFPRHPRELLQRVVEADRPLLDRALRAHLTGELPQLEVEFRLVHADGSLRWLHVRGCAVRAEGGRALRLAGSIGDVTAHHRAEEQLRHDAFHDALTGLPNRALFLERLQQALARQQGRSRSRCSVLLVDLDRFKLINDGLGHFVGDELLAECGARLRRCLRPGDTLARLGGDEFLVLLEEVPDEAEAQRVAGRLLAELGSPVRLRERELIPTASIGITHSRDGGRPPEVLVREADAAMYRAKEQGGGRAVSFEPGMHARAVELLQLEVDLRRALEREELELHYQPLVDLETGQVQGAEALLRWQHPVRGLVAPADFVPLAEQTGLIVPLGSWALLRACAETQLLRQRLLRAGRPLPHVAINLSARQLQERSLGESLARALARSRLPPEALRLEVTESALMADPPRAAEVLTELRRQGAGIDLDDFGTGWSSLAYLKLFRPDGLKIDRTFVGGGGGDREIVRAIVALARGLGLGLVAEGIETPAQLERLRQLGVGLGQGWLFDRALPLPAYEELLTSGRRYPVGPPLPAGLLTSLPGVRSRGSGDEPLTPAPSAAKASR
jgi:diguanylate cyclase (GGDEF)-like protein/PAS domain S-box-containing protein